MKKSILKLSVVLLLCIFYSCSNDSGNIVADNEVPPAAMPTQITIINAFPNLSFSNPLDLQSPNDGTNRIFVVEQGGIVNVFENDINTTLNTVFIDLEGIVDDSDDEMGLLGLAFHPDYTNNGFFYVNYTVSRTLSVISRFQVSAGNPNTADPNSELRLIEIPQPFTNHNGGKLTFGPDGFLYIATGDGGSGGDPQGNAQNRQNLLGNILRIDVNRTENGLNYAIPNDNPFVGNSIFRGEIFAYGLRNPWRISFDIETGVLWAGDVGQNKFEEIDIIESGNNYGWNILEANDCFNATNCDTSGLTPPIFEYNQNDGDLSITGGYVYRGDAVTLLQGRYVYADFVSGRIWSFEANVNGTPNNELLENTAFNISSFGTDMNNELYFCSFDGLIYTFEEN